MVDTIAEALRLLEQFSYRRPLFCPFDLFELLTRMGMFPVPYFALISCLMRRLTFNGRANGFLMRILREKVKSRYVVSKLPLSSRRYFSYLAEIFMSVGDFSAANRFLSCLDHGLPRFPKYPPEGIPVLGGFLMMTQLYHLPIESCDYARILVDDEVIDTVLQSLMHALQSDAGITDSELWFSISTLLVVLKFKMETNNKVSSSYRFFIDAFGSRRIIPPEISDEKKAEIHDLFWGLSVKLKGLLQGCLQRPFFQRKFQRLLLLLQKFCPDISQSDLKVMSEALFESGFSDLSVIAWYEFFVSVDMANPILPVSRFCILRDQECGSVSASINIELLAQLREVTTLTLQSCGITDYIYEESLYAQKESLLKNYISRCSLRKGIFWGK